mgnify:CR=1 FL=1
MELIGKFGANNDLKKSICLTGLGQQFWNLSPSELIEDCIITGDGMLTDTGALAIDTGEFTGRSPKDKYIVKDSTTENTIWWNSEKAVNDNKPISTETWNALKETTSTQLSGKRLFVIDAFCGANENTRLKVRFIMEVAWQAHFVKNMFIRPTDAELEHFDEPDFVVINGSKTSFKDLFLT